MPPLSDAYWRGLEDLAADPGRFAAAAARFPVLGAGDAPRMDRRRALQLMAASLALAGLPGCGPRQPEERILPYVQMPEHLVPGRPQHYASVLTLAGYGRGVLVESHSGRPTKVEGNPDHPASLGASDPFMQAELLGLYDPERSRAPLEGGRISTWERAAGVLARQHQALAARRGAGLAVLTPTVTSPSLAAAIAALRERYPRSTWHSYEPVNRDAVHAGTRRAFGTPLEPVYRPQRARVVLSLGGDFLDAATPGALAYARGLMDARRVHGGAADMARVYALESTPGLTGAIADHRLALAPDEIAIAARVLARALGLEAPGPELPAHRTWLETAAQDLRAAGAQALVVPGERQAPAVHALAHAINARLGALGHTVEMIAPVPFGPTDQAASLEALVEALDAGAVATVLVLGGNPLYDAPAGLRFARAYAKAGLRIHLGSYADETAAASDWHLPEHHPLEAWGDARAYDGTLALRQPLIRPLHDTRGALEVLAMLGGDYSAREHALVQAYWRGQWGAAFDARWRQALHAGVVEGTAAPARPVRLRAPAWGEAPAVRTQALSLELAPDPATFDGRYANNGWLQELPRPLTKLVWGNAALIAPALAAELGLRSGDRVRIEHGAHRLEAPVWVHPGQAERCIGLTLGYGRRRAGVVGDGVGVDAYRLRAGAHEWHLGAVRIARAPGHTALITTQHEGRMHGRHLVREATLAHYRRDPGFAQAHEREHLPSLYPEHPREAPDAPAPHAWGMSIDLSACIGCQACVIACQAENNTPVVGPQEVARGHDMHWLRVDRYYHGPSAAPRTVFQPVPCMHCENAPCEYVCPVAATTHSHEGLNEMTYNRCIGTRDCSQNCPYKVRRFNWFDYSRTTPAAVHNPDVTVRTRGVMEKCTYCVQRISRAHIAAKVEDRPIGPQEVVTACQAACPTQAIVFGDIKNPRSEVHRRKRLPLDYGLLTELGTRPRTTYLARLRHPHPQLEDE